MYLRGFLNNLLFVCNRKRIKPCDWELYLSLKCHNILSGKTVTVLKENGERGGGSVDFPVQVLIHEK